MASSKVSDCDAVRVLFETGEGFSSSSEQEPTTTTSEYLLALFAFLRLFATIPPSNSIRQPFYCILSMFRLQRCSVVRQPVHRRFEAWWLLRQQVATP
jgi:hypothetical protein